LKMTNQHDACVGPFATEAGRFQRSDVAAVACGPGSKRRPIVLTNTSASRRYVDTKAFSYGSVTP
jgi:hypothetical protein